MRPALRIIISILAAVSLSLVLHNYVLNALLRSPSITDIQNMQSALSGKAGRGLGQRVIFFLRSGNDDSSKIEFPDGRFDNDPQMLAKLNAAVSSACAKSACFGSVIMRVSGSPIAAQPQATDTSEDAGGSEATSTPSSEASSQANAATEGGDGTASSNFPPEDTNNANSTETAGAVDTTSATPTSEPQPTESAPANDAEPAPSPVSTKSVPPTTEVGGIAVFTLWTSYALLPNSTHIEHSVHSFARLIERVLFNEDNVGPEDVLLCSGTQKSPPSSSCRDVELGINRLDVSQNGGRTFAQIERSMSFRAMEQGNIQFLIMTWAILCIILMLFLPGFSLRSKHGASLSLIEAHERIRKHFEKPAGQRPTLSIEDRVILPALIASSGDTPLSKGEVLDDIARSRESLRDEVEDTFEFATRTAEHLLKAALFGTALGISTAIFESRGTQSADLVQSLLVQAKMLSSLALGFGTTILGVVGSGLITEVRGWRIDQLLEKIEDAVARWNTAISGMADIPVQTELPRSATSSVRVLAGGIIFGGTFLFFSVLFVVALLYFVK